MSHDKAEKNTPTEDELLMAAVHDIRGHLRTSMVHTQMLDRDLRRPIIPEVRAHLDQIVSAGRDMDALLGRLALYAASSHKREDQLYSEICLLFDSALRQLASRNTDAEINANLIANCDIQAPLPIEAVLRELLDNALKFRQGPVKITILVERSADQYVLGVKDTGIGFDPKYSNQILLPLQRLHPQRIYSGCGMGLAICQRTLQTFGGRIWSESELDNGSTFWFSFPAQRECFNSSVS